ncbi:hypothetical protein [Microbacterium sp. B19]|uniref:hypothetical protein n=1 Tax=Microbacterium sp. B19 TaxID=96765 RepID=UPI00034630F5|nr:hypothetical protein [Microbacterium sp. B19]
MSDEIPEELRRLRARAYGPDADIAADPGALQRLAELEEQQRRELVRPVAPATEVVEATEFVEAVPEDPPVPEADADAEAEEEPPRRGRPIRSRRVFWLWGISLALVAALSSALTVVSVSILPVQTSAGVPQIATLKPEDGRSIPGIFGPASSDGRAYPDFYGMSAFVAYAQFGPDGERNPCIFLTPTATIDELDAGGYSGFSQAGCGAGAFPATLQFVVNSTVPDAFVERFPRGSSVQFVFDGENLGVFSDAG